MRRLLVLAALGMVLVAVAYLLASFRQRPGLESIYLESSSQFLVTAPQSPDVSWTQRNATESPNSVKSVTLRNGPLSGELYANEKEIENPSDTPNLSGFRRFQHSRFPERNIFITAGLNFEHLLSGRARDCDFGPFMGNFAPRKEPSRLRVGSESSAALFWAAANSRWGADSEMAFSLDGENHVDLEFRTAFQRTPGTDYLIYMWASYMQHVRTPAIQFWGVRDFAQAGPSLGKGTLGWVCLDGKRNLIPPSVNDGIVHFLGAPALPVEEGVPDLNYRDHNSCAFLFPFFFGVVDGDGDPSTTQDDMVYIMMFDRAEPVRFIMWNFSPVGRNPVWDWQYVVRKPQSSTTYGYRARLVYKPYAGQDDVLAEYLRWTKSLGTPRHQLKINIVPPESATLFPAESEGVYGDHVHVYLGVNPSKGWHFDHWEGNVTYKKRRFTGIEMNGDEVVSAVCRHEKGDT